MTQKLFRQGWLVACLLTLLLIPYPVAQAQGEPGFASILVELWPEYDRPEVLVIYRAELSSDTALPARLTFQLPGHIESMHAVAVEQNGSLVDVNPDTIEMQREGDILLLSFPSPSPKIQLEYYDPAILTKNGQNRQLDYTFQAPYDSEQLAFEVQEPFQSQEFALTPPPDNTFTGGDGLKYNTINITGVSAGDTFALTATYRRATDALSADNLAGNLAEAPSGLSAGSAGQPIDLDASGGRTFFNSNFTLGYVLIGIGAGLLVATAGYWWWTTRARAESGPPRRRQPRRSRPRKTPPKQPGPEPAAPSGPPPVKAEATGGFCYRCGTPLRADANFCHHCGAERRQS